MEPMPANIEIKAVVSDLERTELTAENLTDSPCQTIQQEDVFFSANAGRLKLRILSEAAGELIFYERPDSIEPKQSDYQILETTNPAQLRRVLGASLGESVIVKKTRRVYLVGQTRIHLDDVEGLGDFIEFEVVLRPGQDPSEGHAIAEDLMRRFGLERQDLIPCAYADLLREKAEPGGGGEPV
jgi:predicted adenylyl cyclase CyaB